MSEKKIELIAQLLAKAESTTPEEAEALTEHAERLMVKYGIEQAVINERRAKAGQGDEEIIRERLDFAGAYRGEMLNLANNVVQGLGTLSGLQYTGGTSKVFNFYIIGYASDVQQAKLLIASLQVQSAVAVRAWWKLNKAAYTGLNGYEQEKARRSFVHGFGTGAGSRIQASRKTIVEEATTGTELVLVSRKAKVDAVTATLSSGRMAKARTATGRDTAAGYGFLAGQQANTGGKAVSQRQGISA